MLDAGWLWMAEWSPTTFFSVSIRQEWGRYSVRSMYSVLESGWAGEGGNAGRLLRHPTVPEYFFDLFWILVL